jgi:hypothetical protein
MKIHSEIWHSWDPMAPPSRAVLFMKIQLEIVSFEQNEYSTAPPSPSSLAALFVKLQYEI